MNCVKNIAFYGLLMVCVQSICAGGQQGQNGQIARVSRESREFLAARAALAQLQIVGASPEQFEAAQARVDRARAALDALRAEQGIQRMRIEENQDHRNR
jgi:flavin-binding protein dodecin